MIRKLLRQYKFWRIQCAREKQHRQMVTALHGSMLGAMLENHHHVDVYVAPTLGVHFVEPWKLDNPKDVRGL